MYTYQNERNADTTKPPIARGRSHSYSGALPSGTVTTISDLKKNQSTGKQEWKYRKFKENLCGGIKKFENLNLLKIL